MSTLNDFVQGYGFSDGDLEKMVLNTKGDTFFEIHHHTTKEINQNDGFAWLLRYNSLQQVTEWEVIPFENCRLGKPDDKGYISHIGYNPYFGTNAYLQNSTIWYDVFNPKGVKDQIINQGNAYKGQIFYYGSTSAISRFYPINEAFSAYKWMRIEAGVSNYHEDNIDNGFLQTFMLVMKGDPNAPSTNPDFQNDDGTTSMTVAQEFDEVVSKNFMGAKRVGNMFVQWVNNNDEKPEIIPMPANNNGDLFVTLDNQATKKITIAFKVPGILANIQEGVSLGGDANQIRVAVKLMQQRVIKKQRVLTDNYSRILRLLARPYVHELKIVPYNPYPELEVLDDKIWAALTPEVQQQWIQDNTEIDLTGLDNEALKTVPKPANYKNAVVVSFPEKVRNNVKQTLDYVDKMGLKCSSKGAMTMSKMIVDNSSMPLKSLKRISSYLKKNAQYSNSANNEGCHVVEYNLWGGKDMADFLEAKIKDFETWLN